ncbi:MAG: DUF1080 domain-containing protein, partial [Phycisphaeraceae bacterium]|nr:DUF1080 domain-containing protein [Phycisphaeraceae bacterium]
MGCKRLVKVGTVCLVVSLLCCVVSSAAPADKFLGHWALHLPNGAGWLGVTQEAGYLDASLLWFGGSVTPVGHVYVDNGVLVVEMNRKQVRTKDDQGNPVRSHTLTRRIELKPQAEGQLVCVAREPRRDGQSTSTTPFIATLIPPMGYAPDLKRIRYADSVALFNGENLSGWKLTSSGAANGWSAKDGVLVNNPVQVEGQRHKNYGNLQTVETFEDFNLKLEVNVPKGSNSGVYLRGIYEIQVADTYGRSLDSHNMGGLYSRITPSESAEKPAGKWQTMDMTLCDRHLTVILNGKTIIDNQPMDGCTGGAMWADQFKAGPIYLQGDHGKVSYRNVVLTPI